MKIEKIYYCIPHILYNQHDMTNNKKLFIISIGPAGSGKGHVEPYLFRILDQHTNRKLFNINNILGENFKSANIDALVESDPEYIKLVLDITDKISEDKNMREFLININNTDLSNKIIKSIINNHQEEGVTKSDVILFQKLEKFSSEYTDAYFNIRKKHSENLDKNLDNWLEYGEHILFETTGVNGIDWLYQYTKLQNKKIRAKYHIILVYPFVEKETILARSLFRFASRVVNYYKYGSDSNYVSDIIQKIYSPPRYPLIFGEKFSLNSSVSQIQDNIATYIDKCSVNKEMCDSIIIFDNTTSQVILFADFTCGKILGTECYKYTNIMNKFDKEFTPNLKQSLQTMLCGNNEQIIKLF